MGVDDGGVENIFLFFFFSRSVVILFITTTKKPKHFVFTAQFFLSISAATSFKVVWK